MTIPVSLSGETSSRQITENPGVRTYPLSKATTNLSALVDEVESTHQPVTITRHGKAAAVLIASEDLATLMEALAWLSDPDHAAEMAEAEGAVARGRSLRLAEVREQLASRR
ncbi:type II toxin-antitoxin system Phd/YefM family antitoxin [Cellulosimicrobium sp. AB352]|uniref:type II toxin-antitoxin system Phd/YefM family antitoxin n=1 Tax=unclassified Cellulosimicrobium TaxID=2624466 RepID=UPI0039E9B710